MIGSGRSGTSTLARAVSALGVDFGNKFKRANRKNPTGFFEDADLLKLSKSVRRAIGVRPDSVHLFAAEQLQGESMAPFRQQARDLITTRFGNSTVWGFKYGRTLRILPFWKPVLTEMDIEPCYVLALRNPLSVARSRAALDRRRGRQEASDLEWLVSVVPFLRQTRPHPLVVVDYDRLMDSPREQLERLGNKLRLPDTPERRQGIEEFAGKFLRPGLRHTRYTEEDLVSSPANRVTLDAYRLLQQLAEDRLKPDDSTFWQAWETIESRLQDMAPVLRLLDQVEAERRRTFLMTPMAPIYGMKLLVGVVILFFGGFFH